MMLEEAIHQRWAGNALLCAMLPAERFTTGYTAGGPTPYATLHRLQTQTLLRTNARDALDKITVRIDLWHADYAAGMAVVQQVKTVFDRSSFALSGGRRVVHMCRTGETAVHQDDGHWHFSIEFVLYLYLPSGV